jgi:hypothetical protein
MGPPTLPCPDSKPYHRTQAEQKPRPKTLGEPPLAHLSTSRNPHEHCEGRFAGRELRRGSTLLLQARPSTLEEAAGGRTVRGLVRARRVPG